MKIRHVASMILIALSMGAGASVTYDYVGPNYTLLFNNDPLLPNYDVSMRVTGFVQFVSGTLAPSTTYSRPSDAGVERFAFSDGIQTISSDEGAYLEIFALNTDEEGHFLVSSAREWYFDAYMETKFSSNFPLRFVQAWGSPIVPDGPLLASGDEAGYRKCPGDIHSCSGNSAIAAFVYAGTWTVRPVPIPPTGLLLTIGAGVFVALDRCARRLRRQCVRLRQPRVSS